MIHKGLTMSISKYDTMDYMGVKGTVQMMKSMMESDYLLDCKYMRFLQNHEICRVAVD